MPLNIAFNVYQTTSKAFLQVQRNKNKLNKVNT